MKIALIDLVKPQLGQEILNIFLSGQAGISTFRRIRTKKKARKIKKIINLLLFLVT